MKLLLLKILLQRRARDEGFTLPMVIAVGLIMILLGAVNILSAGEENLNAISDNQKNEALAIAEIGVTRYRELLDRNRMLTVYSSDSWSSLTNTCNTNSYIADFANTSTWHTVEDGTGDIGQYRLVSYIYDIDDSRDADDNLLSDNNNQFAPNDDNLNDTDSFDFNDTGDTYDPKGILTIKSQAADGSEAQVQVEIPIRINEGDMDNLRPALWIGNRNATDFGNLKLGIDDDLGEKEDGNIVLTQPATVTGGGITAADGCTDPANIGAGTVDPITKLPSTTNVISDPRPLPSIVDPDNLDELDPLEKNFITFSDISSNNIPSLPDKPRPLFDSASQEMLLGIRNYPALHKEWKEQTWARGQSTKYYFYQIPGLNIDGEKLISDGSARVVLYVDGDISLTNRAILDAGGRYASSILLEIYGTSNTQNITFTPNGNTIDVTALIHAPNATVKVEGASGKVNIKGAVWVKDWDDNSGGAVEVTITPDNAGFGSRKSFDYYLGTDNTAAKPITDAPTNWVVQEVDDEPSP